MMEAASGAMLAGKGTADCKSLTRIKLHKMICRVTCWQAGGQQEMGVRRPRQLCKGMMAMKIDSQADSAACAEARTLDASTQQAAAPLETRRRKRVSMHDGIGVWCDCCSCEAEPRWVAVAEELGIDLSDYEDADEDADASPNS
jgi:hypothetical protein